MSYIDGAGGGGGAGTGTVTNVATTAPVAGGPITTTGTISITGAAGQVLAGAGPAFTATPTLGVATSALGTLSLCGNTSGTVLITPQAAAGTPTLTLPTTTGTLASSATSPLVLSATTGVLTAPTAVTSAAALTANNLVIGGGSQASAALGSLGTTTTLLHGNAAGAPTFGAVVNADITSLDASTKLTGVVPLANGGRTLLNNQFANNTLTGDSTDQVIFTYSMPAATIAAGEGIEIWTRFNQTGTTSTNYKINFGGTTMLATASTTAGNAQYMVKIFNQSGVTNAQCLMGKLVTANAVVSGTFTDGAIDTTGIVVVTLTFNVANTVTITGTRFWAVEIIH